VALFLGLVFGATFFYSRGTALRDKEEELRYAARAFQMDAPEYPDLAELSENHPNLVATVFDGSKRAERHTGPIVAPWCSGYQVSDAYVLFGLDVAGKHVVLGAPWRDTALGLDRLAAVLGCTWILLVAIVAIVTATSAQAIFLPLRRLAHEANALGGSDLSRRLQVEDDAEFGEVIEELNAMLERLERSAAREKQFSTDVSHELRTPLAIIRTQIEATLLRERSHEAYVEALTALLPEVDRLASIAEALLATARSLGTDSDVVDIEPVVREIVKRWDPRYREAGQWLTIRSCAVKVRVSPSELEIVLNNLLENALNFSAAGATTSVDLGQSGGTARLTISDQGIGIPKESSDSIFDRFVRIDSSRNRATGGFGIGLALVKKVVESRGGTIRYEALSPGSRFLLEWPT
jgi:signal transduction histidine kinase